MRGALSCVTEGVLEAGRPGRRRRCRVPTPAYVGVAAGAELLSRDRSVLGDHVVTRARAVVRGVTIAAILGCVLLLVLRGLRGRDGQRKRSS